MTERLKLNFTPIPNIILDQMMRMLAPGAPGFVMKNNGGSHESPVLSEMRGPSCDAVSEAFDSPDISPAMVRCPACGYSETEKWTSKKGPPLVAAGRKENCEL
jgi:hypothetical protein